MHSLRFLLVVATVASCSMAQGLQIAGTLQRSSNLLYTRGPVGLDRGELLHKIPAADLQGFGVEAAHPGFQVIRGVTMPMRDFGSSTPNSLFDVAIYTESLTQPGYPDLQAPLATFVGASVDRV